MKNNKNVIAFILEQNQNIEYRVPLCVMLVKKKKKKCGNDKAGGEAEKVKRRESDLLENFPKRKEKNCEVEMPKKKRKCLNCGIYGHNKTSCQNHISSEEESVNV